MGVLATAENQIKLFYNSKNSLGKQTKAYVKSSEKKISTINTSKDNLTGTQWAEIADGLNLNVSDLIDKEQPEFKKVYGDSCASLEESEWFKILEKNPQLVSKPILLVGDNFYSIDTPSDVVKFIEPDSAKLENQNK
ncbi:ArsC/Spx/MgsR family protein [Aurantibacter sp.]|uniref:arsenate reductase family protein n=1 Tax=Aurantibacter sp. TaxID=2807103 RepID=UPI003266DDFA